MNNYELLGKLSTIHEECEDMFVNIGSNVDAIKSKLITDPEECDSYLIEEAILAKMITDITILKELINNYNNIVVSKFEELKFQECEDSE